MSDKIKIIEQFINWGALHYLPEARERVKQALSEIKQLQDANKCSYGDCDIYEVFYRD